MDGLHKGWFTEFSPDDVQESTCPREGGDEDKQLKSDGITMGGAWPGQAFSLQVNKVLFHERSKYQDVLVFESRSYGNVLVLDGIIQCTERDEFAYQEMLAHLPMFAHPCPKKVLVIGGGDGGILREVLKHDCVESVSMCEIDEMVINASKKFLPHMSVAFNNPKLNLTIGDGFEFLKKHKNEFDVVITDSSDPIGPAESLFGRTYYELIKDSLRQGGVLASQGESMFLHLNLIKHMLHFTRNTFASAEYANSMVPTYPSGCMGYLLACTEKRDLSVPAREISDVEVKKMGLRYYNSAVHRAAFVLPQFVKEQIAKCDINCVYLKTNDTSRTYTAPDQIEYECFLKNVAFNINGSE
ncbi:Spermidine synthase [Toxocara canis]|uniref:Spermidine synthase n=1 Tax=Toxocara canis TaxID=6265 RepID=A0A0B2V470_TOXCA|nr:Spermidine synthase [Toxocara canis]